MTDGARWPRVSGGALAGAPAAEGSPSGSSPGPHLTPHAWAWAAQPACPAVPSCNPSSSLPAAVNPFHQLPARVNWGAGQLGNSVSQPPPPHFDARKEGEKIEQGRKQKGERARGRAEQAGVGILSSCQDGCSGVVWCSEWESKTCREGGSE